mmetsp:Transcript_34990/g.138610  ORF Transcript_34990/g.138610 Transcript_34990/m.138610 type:complete len:80 (-) Transcript_34990:103-342(-)
MQATSPHHTAVCANSFCTFPAFFLSMFCQRFDVIGGTSTGAIIAGALGVMKKPVEEVEALYRELITKIFAKHPVSRYDR